MPSGFQHRWQVAAKCGFALVLFQCCGCAQLAVVKTKPAQLPRTSVAEGPLESAKRYLAAAEHEQPLPSLSHDLLAAKISYGILERIVALLLLRLQAVRQTLVPFAARPCPIPLATGRFSTS